MTNTTNNKPTVGDYRVRSVYYESGRGHHLVEQLRRGGYWGGIETFKSLQEATYWVKDRRLAKETVTYL